LRDGRASMTDTTGVAAVPLLYVIPVVKSVSEVPIGHAAANFWYPGGWPKPEIMVSALPASNLRF